jgi:hypothetical protein
MDPVSDPLLLRKSGSAGNRTRDFWVCSQELLELDQRSCQLTKILNFNSTSRFIGQYLGDEDVGVRIPVGSRIVTS